jgi:hypothetical protein
MNAWGSGENGKTKACKNMRHIYLLRDGEYMPLQVTLPPTSLRPYSDFYSAVFASRRRGTCGSIVQLGLKRMNNGKDEYSVATFRHLYDFTGEQLARVKLYAEGFRQQIKAMLAQRERDAEAKAADADVLDYDGAIERGADGTFTIGNGDYIDERERLPA